MIALYIVTRESDAVFNQRRLGWRPLGVTMLLGGLFSYLLFAGLCTSQS